MKRWTPVFPLLIASFTGSVRADWANEVGFKQLQTELGIATPNGAGVKISQVESSLSPGVYSAVTGDGIVNTGLPGDFTGKTFNIKSGASTQSFHAYFVAQQMVGLGSEPSRYGMATGVTELDGYEVNDWLETGFLNLTSGLPLTESGRVQNHSWIFIPTTTAEINDCKKILRRADWSINTDKYLCCVGMNNDGSSVVPALMATGYNVISVGLTSGSHSRGLTSSSFDGPGRTKPELVAPSDFTSFATGMVSGSGAVLREVAATTDAQQTETLRAVMLAGATKEEFPTWARTTTRPLDAIYGAGELNIYHSYKILSTTQQSSSPSTPVTLQGWDYQTVTNGANFDYIIEIPSNLQGASLSAALVWNRTVTHTNGPFPNFSYQTLPNLSLRLYKLPGSPGTQLDISNSAVDNLEHIWQPALTCGTYRLRISGDSTLSIPATLAWRVTPPLAAPTIAVGPVQIDQPIAFTFTYLVPSQLYVLQDSDDMQTWNDLYSFTPTSQTDGWNAPANNLTRRFYRLKWICP